MSTMPMTSEDPEYNSVRNLYNLVLDLCGEVKFLRENLLHERE